MFNLVNRFNCTGSAACPAAMKKFSDLMSKINTTLSQQCFITMGVNEPLGCAKNYEDKYLPNITNLATSIGDAAKNGNMDRMSYLSKQLVQLSCCGSWSMMDCMIGITKVYLLLEIE